MYVPVPIPVPVCMCISHKRKVAVLASLFPPLIQGLPLSLELGCQSASLSGPPVSTASTETQPSFSRDAGYLNVGPHAYAVSSCPLRLKGGLLDLILWCI